MFKERARTNDELKKYNLTVELLDAVTKLKKTLFATESPKQHTANPNRNSCSGLRDEYLFKDESRLCKCLFYFNNDKPKKCDSCAWLDRYILSGFSIPDYEVPPLFKNDGIGRIDLIIKPDGEDFLYATEVKSYSDDIPPQRGLTTKNNEESLIRMVGEIMTYTYGSANSFKKAIGFFENSPQHKEYLNLPFDSPFWSLLNHADITVFMFTRKEPVPLHNKCITPGVISIEKLYSPSTP